MTAVIFTPSGSDASTTDLFCGAGGSSIAAREAGAVVKVALNHWDRAIETHQTNFQNTYHERVDISLSEPRRYPRTNVLIASPECTEHTLAKGVARRRQRSSLWGDIPDPGAVRSRATMWDVPRFAEIHNYELIIMENVADARKWIFWDSWIHAMTVSLKYNYREIYFNSMFAPPEPTPVPQSRDRLYMVFWKRGNKKPDLDFYPPAWCTFCEKDVAAVQCWKNPNKKWGKYRFQYTYNCPNCTRVVQPYYYCAASMIDWEFPIGRIGDRARKLQASTIRRIEKGLERFVYQPVPSGNEESVPPFLFAPGSGGLPQNVLESSYPTQTTAATPYLTVPPHSPFLVDSGGVWESPAVDIVRDPYPTQTTRRQPAVVLPFMIQTGHGGHESAARVREITRPISTQHSVTADALVCAPYLMQYNKTSTGLLETSDAIPTQTTKDRHAVVLAPIERPSVDDCYFRMVQPHEVHRAMGFPNGYVVTGTVKDQIQQYGNAVTPGAFRWIFNRAIETLKGA